MPDSIMTRKQAGAWLLTAMLAPLARVSGAGWTTIAASAAIALPLWLLPGCFETLPKPILFLEWGSVILAGMEILPAAGSCWPGAQSETVVPVVLLLLAAMTENVPRSANAAGILCWMVGILGAAVLCMSVQGVRLNWMQPAPLQWNPQLLLVLLLPGLSSCWPEKPRKSLLGTAAMAVVLGVLVQGSLSAAVAGRLEAPFYEMARSLRLGSLSRLEPVCSIMLTLSWFALCLYLVMAAKTILEASGIQGKPALWAGVIGMGLGVILHTKSRLPAWPLGTGILWVFLPLTNFLKRSKKDEKRC